MSDRAERDRKSDRPSDRPSDIEELARYQTALLEALADAESPEDVQRRLLAREDLRAQHDYVSSFEPRALEVGMTLVRLWGERLVPRPSGFMRAPTFVGSGLPLSVRILPVPDPARGQVRIRVHASGICGTDVHMMQGSFRTPVPIVPGHEPVGVIDALGEGVLDLSVGDRVGVPWVQDGCGACPACGRGALHQCMRPVTWLHHGGGHAEWMIAEARGCVRLPEGLAFVHAAPLFCAGFTVISGLRRATRGTPERVGVLGIGGLGHLAVQVARAEGHAVIAITGSESKRRDALSMGASEVLVPKAHVGKELMAMGGVDVLLATSNDLAQASEAIEGLTPEGRLVLLGLPSHEATSLTLPHRRMLGMGLTVLGGKQGPRRDLDDLLTYAAAGAVLPHVEPYPLGQVARAMQRLVERRVRYRAVLLHAGG